MRIVMLTQPGCSQCKTMARMLGSRIAESIDIMAHPDIVERYDVRSVPAFLVYQDDAFRGMLNGMMPVSVFDAKVQSLLEG